MFLATLQTLAASGRVKPIPVWIPFAIIIGLGVVAYLWELLFSRRARAKRLLGRTPATSIEKAYKGQVVKIVGRIKTDSEPLVSPLSQRQCVYYETAVGINERNSGRSYKETDVIPFILEDDTGEISIEIEKAAVVLDTKSGRLWNRGDYREEKVKPYVEFFLNKHGNTSEFLGTTRNVSWKEGELEIGETVAAVGLCKEIKGTGADGKWFSKKYLVPAHKKRIIITDEFS